MLNEKRCAAALRAAFKGSGYRVLLNGGLVSVRAGCWAFEIGEEFLPREVLGRIVEHIGLIPGNGEAYLCRKGNVGQTLSVDEELLAWEKLREEARQARTPVRVTRLWADGFQIWQETQNMRVLLIDPDRLQIVDPDFYNTAMCRADGEEPPDRIFLCRLDEHSLAAVIACERGENDGGMERLDGFPWRGEGVRW